MGAVKNWIHEISERAGWSFEDTWDTLGSEKCLRFQDSVLFVERGRQSGNRYWLRAASRLWNWVDFLDPQERPEVYWAVLADFMPAAFHNPACVNTIKLGNTLDWE